MTTTNIAVGDILLYSYTGAVQPDTLPPGTYKLECWGAQGRDRSSTSLGGRGGYSVGTLTLKEEMDIYVYAGGQGATVTMSNSGNNGGFNGGGSSVYNSSYPGSTGAGGGSDIRLGTDSLYARVIVAGGGGGQPSRNPSSQAGHGGGSISASGAFGIGTSAGGYRNGPGGGGWYGGDYGYRTGGSGGSGYVYTESTASNYPSGCLLNESYYLTDASTTIGDTSGHAGDGEVKITVLSLGGGGKQSTIVPDYGIPPYIPPTWSGGTDAEIVEALEKHYAGEIDLTEYWQVGDERVISLSAMSATGVGESHVAQDVTFVIMNKGGKTLADGETECAFIVGQKDSLKEAGYMNSSNTNSGGWKSCDRKTWCNVTYRNSIPSTLRGIFKQHVNKTAENGTNLTVTSSTDYFALPADKEVFGSGTFNARTEESNQLSQFKWYETSANRIKKRDGSVGYWWERSPLSGDPYGFCLVRSDGSAGYEGAYVTFGIAPFGVI